MANTHCNPAQRNGYCLRDCQGCCKLAVALGSRELPLVFFEAVFRQFIGLFWGAAILQLFMLPFLAILSTLRSRLETARKLTLGAAQQGITLSMGDSLSTPWSHGCLRWEILNKCGCPLHHLSSWPCLVVNHLWNGPTMDRSTWVCSFLFIFKFLLMVLTSNPIWFKDTERGPWWWGPNHQPFHTCPTTDLFRTR